MVWLRDVLDPSKPLACETGHDVTIELYPEGLEDAHALIRVNLRLCPMPRPVGCLPTAKRLPTSKPAEAIQGTIQVSVLYGSDLPNREMIGKQDPYVIASIKHVIHPLNRMDGLASEQVSDAVAFAAV